MTAVGRRSAVVVVAALVAFALAFAVARAIAGGSDGTDATPVRDLPAGEVAIENLERAPSIKPLRSIAGEPSSPAPAVQTEPAPTAPPK